MPEELEGEIISYFLGFDPALRQDPHPFFDRLRSTDRAYHSGLGPWFVTGLEESQFVMRDQRLSNSPRNAIGGFLAWSDDLPETVDGGARPFFRVAEPTILFNDPPRHTRLRRLVAKAFTPRAVAGQRARAEVVARDLLGKLREQDSFDFFHDFAYLLPLTIISEMLEVPIDRLDDFLRWGEMIRGQAEPGNRQNEEYLARADVDALEALEFFGGLIEERRKAPGEDIISTLLAAAREEGSGISDEEIVCLCLTLHIAGQDLTAAAMASGFYTLSRHPDQRRLLVDAPELIGQGFEEMVRYEPPPRASVPRFALEDVALPDGRIVAKGDTVFVLIGAANRDPRWFAEPHRFDVTRTDNPHLGFGHGLHFCIGGPLARAEATAAFHVLLREYPELVVLDGQVEWRNSVVVRAVENLPVAWVA